MYVILATILCLASFAVLAIAALHDPAQCPDNDEPWGKV
jgi:hypothetical protein